MRHLTLTACLAALLVGCDASTPPSGADVAADPAAALASAAQAVPGEAAAEADGPSFGPWRERLDELLTLELAAEVAGLPANAAEKDYIDGLPQIAYAWPSERTQEYAGMQLAKKNRVSIANIQTGITPAFFRSRFVAASPADSARLDEEVERQVAQGRMDTKKAGQVRDLASALGEVSPSEELPGLGDVAVWETGEHEQALYLLVNGSSLRITVDISDDPIANRDASVALARRLIERL